MQTALALLQPTVSYAQKRADADRNLTIQTGLTQLAQQDAETARQQRLLMLQQMAQLKNVPLLEKDQERWQGVIDQLKGKIRQRFENDFGGDDEEYARTMLDSDIEGLTMDALKSPLYRESLQRRSNFLQAQKDAQDGKIYRTVNYRLTNGQQKTAPWEQAYLDFANGDTEELPYNGGFKVEGKWRKHFDDTYSPRVNQLGKFQPDKAQIDEIASALMTTEGLTAADAAEYLRRTGAMQGPIWYKYDAKNPYEEERLRQGRQNIALSRERNQIAREKNKIDKDASSQMDWWDATFNNSDNIITRAKDGQPGAINATLFDPEMRQAGSLKLQGFNGKVVGKSLLESTGAVFDKKTNMHAGAGGQAFVTVKNKAGGLDLRSTDLTGLHYKTVPGNVYRFETAPTEYERQTGRKPYKFLQEQTIIISSDEAKKAKSGPLFGSRIPGMENFEAGFLGNEDTPTGKGAYTPYSSPVVKDGPDDKKTYYKFKILQPVSPTMIDRVQPTLDRMNTQTKTGQAAMYDANDDLNYY